MEAQTKEPILAKKRKAIEELPPHKTDAGSKSVLLRLEKLCREGRDEDEIRTTAQEVAESGNSVSRLTDFVVMAAKQNDRKWAIAGRIIWEEFLRDKDRQRAMIMSNAFRLGQDSICSELSVPMDEWWEKVVRPLFERQRPESRLPMVQIWAKDAGKELYWVIGLVELLEIPDKMPLAKILVNQISGRLRDLWNDGQISAEIWSPILAALAALINAGQ